MKKRCALTIVLAIIFLTLSAPTISNNRIDRIEQRINKLKEEVRKLKHLIYCAGMVRYWIEDDWKIIFSTGQCYQLTGKINSVGERIVEKCGYKDPPDRPCSGIGTVYKHGGKYIFISCEDWESPIG